MTAFESDPSASATPASRSRPLGAMPSARSRSVVGHRQTVAPRKSAEVVVGDVHRVHGSERRTARARVVQQPRGGLAVRLDAGGVLSRLLADVGVQRQRSLLPPTERPPAIASGGTARTLWIAAADVHLVRRLDRGDPLRPRFRAAVAEAAAARPRRAGRCRPRGSTRRSASRRTPAARAAAATAWPIAFGSTYRTTVGAVVQVVELADGRDARERHLAVRRPGQRVHRVRIEERGELVHLLAPRPERARPSIRAPAQRAMEDVRVRVDEPGQRDAGRRTAPDGHGCDRLT